jgi:hypothetical protein
MENLTWIIAAIGVLVGGRIMMFGYRKTDQKPVASGQIAGALKQDWVRTGNIDFDVSAIENSSPQPLRLLVEEKRVVESAVGQDLVELRWRLATVEEGKALVVFWNGRRLTTLFATALVQDGSTATPSVPNVISYGAGRRGDTAGKPNHETLGAF